MPDWFTGTFAEVVKIAVGVFLGVVAKVIYDRRFAKRPDLRYEFQRPATFGAGEKEKVFQNLVLTNEGMETANDVRISFKRPVFEKVEHHISFDGPYQKDSADDCSVIVLKNLPPKDVAIISFVFVPSELTVRSIDEVFLSARASNCIGNVRTPKESNWLDAVYLSIMGVLVLTFFVWFPLFVSKLIRTDSSIDAPEKVEVARLVIQAPKSVKPGSKIAVDVFIDNLSQDPLIGEFLGTAPWWVADERQGFLRRLSLSAGKRQSLNWKFTVPADTPPGRYAVTGMVAGYVLAKYVHIKSSAVVEVK